MITDEEMKERYLRDIEERDPPECKVWFESRPPVVQAAILKRPPNYLYDLRGQQVNIFIYDEPLDEPDREVTVLRQGLFPMRIFDVQLDSLKPLCHVDDLEEFRKSQSERFYSENGL